MTSSQQRSAVSILDTVCVLFFTASGQLNTLVAILQAANFTMLVPAEVLAEAERRAKLNGWNIRGLQGQPYVQVLPEITAASPKLLGTLARLRKAHPGGGQGAADLGECVVIAHAVRARSQVDVVVCIDDLNGQKLAAANSLVVLSVEDLLHRGVQDGVLTRAQARAAYNKMRPFGSSLPTWEASTLKRMLG